MTGNADDGGDLWEVHARWWQDDFTDGADPEYRSRSCRSPRRTSPARDECSTSAAARVRSRGSRSAAGASLVVGVDPTGRRSSSRPSGAGDRCTGAASASALPFADASFDAVVACLVFEHIDEVDDAIAEVGRVLVAGGRFLFFLNHPLLQTPNSGWIDDQMLDPPEQYWRIGAYLVEDRTIEEVEKDVFIPFVHRPLSRYVNAMAAAGLVVRRMDEPAPPPGFLARAAEYAAAATIPRLLFLRAEKTR